MPLGLRRGLWIVGILGLGATLAAGLVWNRGGSEAGRPTAKRAPALDADAPLSVLAEGLRRGEGTALVILHERLVPGAKGEGQDPSEADRPLAPLAPGEAAEWIEVLKSLRLSLPKLSAAGKRTAQELTARILERFQVEPTPAGWSQVLSPSIDVLTVGLTDPDLEVRAAALAEVGRLWAWVPGITMSEPEGRELADWKEGLHAQVIQRLADPEPRARASAAACLALLPIDDAAAPALAYLHDPDPGVRLQVLAAFAQRPTLLTEDALLPILHDPVPELGNFVERILKNRGLSQEQIGLGRLATHPKPDLRASAIPLLLRRDDIDPTVWLLHLSNDPDESVRLKAVEAFAGRITPEVNRRLRALGQGDTSPAVRAAARKLAPEEEQATVSLPPLPGSVRLTPTAN